MDAALREECLKGLRLGAKLGWWHDVDERALLPILEMRRDTFGEHATWAHVWHGLGRFPSMKEAKRAGHGVPLTRETRRLGTMIVRVV